MYPWLAETAAFEADSILPPRHWAYAGDDPAFTRYPFLPEQGMALLEEAGWTLAGGASYRANAQGAELALTLTTTDARFRQTWAAVWEEQMRVCGIRLIRNHVPAEWFFGETTGLGRRDFEVAAFGWIAGEDIGGLKLYARYACDQVPTAANDWQGQNYSGWCSDAGEAALLAATARNDADPYRQALQGVQREYARDVPGLLLFFRVSLFAVDPALEGFLPPDDGLHTWNAAGWRIPGEDTIVIGMDAEPAAPLWFEQAYVAGVIQALVAGADAVRRDYQYQPVLLRQLPSMENGGVVEKLVLVKDGDGVVDWAGEPVELAPGVTLRDVGGNRLQYAGGDAVLVQLVVTYEFLSGLTWSDGQPVSRADYALAYRAMCDPAIRGAGPFSATFPDPFPACDQIAGVEFLSDSVYRVTWKPGFTGARLSGRDIVYTLPPFSRLPAHQALGDGRRLVDVPPGEWAGLDAVKYRPLGMGPYVIREWTHGKHIVLEASHHYFQGPPATPRIVIRFLDHDTAIRALAGGEVDVLDWETIGPDDVEAFDLLQAQTAGKVRLLALASSIGEQVDFALIRK